jgi:hypothetical protein
MSEFVSRPDVQRGERGKMTKELRPDSLKLRLLEWWWEPASKVLVGFSLVGIVAIVLFSFGPARKKWDFWNSHGLGMHVRR